MGPGKGLGSSLSSVSATTRLARCFSWGCMASISKNTCKGGRSSSSSSEEEAWGSAAAAAAAPRLARGPF